MLHTGEGRINIGLTVREIEEILGGNPGPTLIVRLLRAMKLLDAQLAHEYGKAFGILV